MFPAYNIENYTRFSLFLDPDDRRVRAWRRGRAAKLVKTRTSAVSRHACALGVNGTPYKMYTRPSQNGHENGGTGAPAHRARGRGAAAGAALNSTNRNSNTSLYVKVSHKCRIHRPIQTTDKRQPGNRVYRTIGEPCGEQGSKGVAEAYMYQSLSKPTCIYRATCIECASMYM